MKARINEIGEGFDAVRELLEIAARIGLARFPCAVALTAVHIPGIARTELNHGVQGPTGKASPSNRHVLLRPPPAWPSQKAGSQKIVSIVAGVMSGSRRVALFHRSKHTH